MSEVMSAMQKLAKRVCELEARSTDLGPLPALAEQYPLGCKVIKTSGPQWRGVVVGYYSSSYTPEGLVIECTAEGARGQVHVEPSKRMARYD